MMDKGSAVLYALFGVAKKYDKGYCYPTQNHIVHLVQKYEKISMSRRTLCRVLKKLEEQGYIKRQRRHTHRSDGSLWLRSTLYRLKKRAYIFLGQLRSLVSRLLAPFAVPKMAQYSSQSEKEIFNEVTGNVEILLNSALKGRPPPVFLHG
jgi:DNA-binding transcriptional ArsR family regulator